MVLTPTVHAVSVSVKLSSLLLDVAQIQEDLNAMYERRGHLEVASLLEA